MNTATRFPVFLILALSSLFAGSPGAKAVLVLYSGKFGEAELVAFDSDDFSFMAGQMRGSLTSGQDLTVDETGRLFGIEYGRLFEYDAKTLQPIREQSLGGGTNANGLAARNGFIYLHSGSRDEPMNVVKIDAHSFEVVAGTLHDTIWGAGQDLAFDESGRLFGISYNHLYEYNPETLEIIHNTPIDGLVNGLAARNGILYTYSGYAETANLLAFDANTFELLSGTLQTTGTLPMDLAFGDLDRLFGILSGTLYEYDPVTLEILNSAPVVGGMVNDLAVIPEPTATALFILAVPGLLLAYRRRHRCHKVR